LNTQTGTHPTYYRFLYFTALAFALGVAAGGIFSYVGAPIVSIILFVLALFVALYAAVQIRARQRSMNAS
jgi:Flp pilus assembly protein TadB